MTRVLLTLTLTAATTGLALAGVIVPIPRLPGPVLRQAAAKAEKTPDDPAAIAARIAKNTKAAADRLKDQDTGTGTRKTQEQTLKDIDELLKQAENPPPKSGDGGGGSQNDPPPQGGDSQPKGGGQQPMGGKQNQGGGQSKQPRGSKGERKPQGQQTGKSGQQPMPGGQQGAKQESTPTGPMPRPGQPGGKQPATQGGTPQPGVGGKGLPLDDPVAKQVWGHLPERLRQQMSQYYREQFMPKYSPLIRDYFSSLAEREKKK